MSKLFISILLLIISSFSYADPYPFILKVDISKAGDNASVYAYNLGNVPITFRLIPKSLLGFKLSGSSHKPGDPIVIPPLSKNKIFYVNPDPGYDISNFAVQYFWTFGNAKTVKKMDYLYPLPYSQIKETLVERLYQHSNQPILPRYSYAYNIKGKGGQIINSRPGRVFDLRVFEQDAPNESDKDIFAYVKVMHQDGTWSEYFNIPYNTIQVKLNQYLYEGTPIAKADTFTFAVQKPLLDATPEPIYYEFQLNTGGMVDTGRIASSLNLTNYDPNKFSLSPWLGSLIPKKMAKKTFYIILAAASLLIIILTFLSYKFYVKRAAAKKIKLIEEESKVVEFTDAELQIIKEQEERLLKTMTSILKVNELKNSNNY